MRPKKRRPWTDGQVKDVLEFARVVYEPKDLVEIRCFGDSKKLSVKKYWLNAEDIRGDFLEELDLLNQNGYGIFAGVAIRQEHGASSDKGVSFGRVAWADVDYTSPEEVMERIASIGMTTASLLVRSGNGSHLYQRFDEPVTPDKLRRVNEILAHVLDSDRAVVNPSRVMRIPGFYNMKDPGEPKLVHVVRKEDELCE